MKMRGSFQVCRFKDTVESSILHNKESVGLLTELSLTPNSNLLLCALIYFVNHPHARRHKRVSATFL